MEKLQEKFYKYIADAREERATTRATLDILVSEVKKTNGRVTRLEKVILIGGTAITVLTVAKWPQVLSFFTSIIL
jgi:hypothetical protein